MDNYNETDLSVEELIENGQADITLNLVDALVIQTKTKELASMWKRDTRSSLQKFGSFNYDSSSELLNLYVSHDSGVDYAALTIALRKTVLFFSGTGYIFAINLEFLDESEDRDRIKRAINKELKDFKVFVSNK